MAVNQKVLEKSNELGEAYSMGMGLGTIEYKKAQEEYFRVLEEELRKEPDNGWIDMENPKDFLYEMIEESDARYLADALYSYMRFCKVVEDVTGKNVTDINLVVEATNTIVREMNGMTE